jgi:trimeric autotransporter adhesin
MRNFLNILFAAAVLFCPAAQAAVPQAAEATAVRALPGASGQDGVPRLVQFNGTLRDAATRPVVGVASVTFAIYAEQDGGAALWSETQNVIADASGHYNVLLGGATANGVPAELFGTGQSRWLGVTIARQAEMPRVLLASVPYALKAADADTLGGLPASAYITSAALAASNARVMAPSTGNATIIATTPAAAQPAADASQSSVTQATPSGSGTTNFIPLWTSSSALGNSVLFQSNSRIGIGTTTPAETLDVSGDSIFRGSVQLPPQGTATASIGQPSRSFQWEASLYNSSSKGAVSEAFGFRAVPATNNTSNPTAKFDLFYGPGGGTLTDLGFSFSSSGIITFAPGQTFNGTSETLTGSLNLPNTSGTSTGVIALGGQTFLSDAGATTNSFVGAGAGGSAEVSGTSNNNTGVGNGALGSNNTGTNNTASGAGALGGATSSNYDTAYGVQAMEFETTGGSNTAIGYAAGMTEQTGAFNTFVGANADTSMPNLTHATAIGAGAIVEESNAIVLGGINPNASNVGIGTTKPLHTLEVIDHGAGGAGIWADSSYSGDNAIYGGNDSTSGSSNGGYFTTASAAGSGVVGVNTGGGRAGYFGGTVEVAGNLQVDGTLTKGGGSFKIDDPIAPAEKYLSHSFVESPDMMNIYNGIAVLDAKGAAWVQMPEWFDALNQDFRYQLTSIGRPGPSLYIAREVKDNRFKIAGGRPGLRVSWQVTGIRHDAWANAHRIPTEEVKPADEQGRYLYPELFGASKDHGINALKLDAPSVIVPFNTANQHAPQGNK